MKLLKRITSVLLALVTGACLITYDHRPAHAEENAYTGEYAHIDSSRYRRWTGTEEFRENQNYYIDRQIRITEEKRFTLPKGSRLLIKDGGELVLYSACSLTVKGALTVEPAAAVIISGEFIASPDSLIENHGTFTSTKSAVLQLSSKLLTGSTGITILSGETNVYSSGQLINFHRLTFSKNSVTTLTGGVICEKNGSLFLKGEFSVTMNGFVDVYGNVFADHNIAVGGIITLRPYSKCYTANGAVFTLSRAGQFIDKRGETAPENEEPAPDYSEYDKSPDKVSWIGIDVSRYNGAIDWARVKRSGVDFVLLRSSIGDGTEIISGQDIRFAYNIVEAKKAGLMVGAYHYLWAETPEEALAEAKFFVKTLAPYEIDFPAVLDFEDPWHQENLNNEERTEIAKVFLAEVKRAGYYPMLYTNTNWAENYLNMDELSEYELWLAEWFPEPSYGGDFGIWQYTAYGDVTGIDGDVDLDVCTKNYRKIIREGGYNNLEK